LGNIDDFEPASMAVAYEDMFEIDSWAMQQLQKTYQQSNDRL